MKKLILILVFLIANANCYAVYNFVATGDYVQVPAFTSGIVINDILRNDLDGHTGFGFDDFATPVDASGVSISVLTQSSPYVYLSGRSVVVDFDGPVPDGLYTLTYQICRNANGQCSTVGTISVKIGGSTIAAPTMSFEDPGCGYTTVMNISGLPSGNWILNIERGGIWHKALTGSGSSYTTGTTGTVTDLTPGHQYRMSVVDLGSMAVSQFSPIITLPEYTCLYSIDKQATYVDYNNDGIRNIGDRVEYIFTVTNLVATGFDINNVEIWNFGVVCNTLVPVLAYNTPALFTAYHDLTQRDVDLGVVCIVTSVQGTRSIHDYTQSFTHTYYLPEAPTGMVGNLFSCDFEGDGIAYFDLLVQTPVITGANPDYSVAYYESLAGAEAQNSAITALSNYAGINGQTIYARRTESSSGDFSILTFELETGMPPQSANVNVEAQTVTVAVIPPGMYEFSIDNGAFQQSPIFSDVPAGEHTITIQALNGCGVLMTSTNVLGIESMRATANGIWPNPVRDRLHLELDDTPLNVRIIDIYGKIISEARNPNTEIDVSGLSAGPYIVVVETDRGSETFKITKQ